MSVNNKTVSRENTLLEESFTNDKNFKQNIKFQSVMKPVIDTCVVCRKVFKEDFAERDPLISRARSQSKEKPVCSDCDKIFIQTTPMSLTPRNQFDDDLQSEGSSDECVAIQGEGDIDEQLTNTHISGEYSNSEKKDEWVVIKFDENDDELDSEKLFSIKLCNDECDEECMIIQTGEDICEEGVRTFPDTVKGVNEEEYMVTQSDEYTVTDIIQIGSLSFDNVYEQSEENVYQQDDVYEQVDDTFEKNVNRAVGRPTTSELSHDANQTWSICTNKFTTGDGKLDDWSICTKGFSIRGQSSRVCQICSKYFKCESDLKFHMISHSPEKTSSPIVSHDPGNDPSSLEVHGGSPTNCDLYLCNICKKSFSDTNALKVHAKIHSGSLPDSSGNIYFKKISSKGMVNKNTFFHASDKQFLCTICGTRFQHKHQLAKHSKTHMMLACKMCQRVFKSSAKLKKHMFQMCGKLGGLSGENSSNENPISAHSSKKSLLPFQQKNDSDLNDYGETTSDSDMQDGEGKSSGKNYRATKRSSVRERNKMRIDTLNDSSQRKELARTASEDIYVTEFIEDLKDEDLDIKDENFDTEDFPMVEDYYMMFVKDEDPNCSGAFTSKTKKKVAYDTVKSKSSKR